MPRLSLIALLVLLPHPTLAAEKLDPLTQWPHWRGPRADGSAPNATPPLKWDATTNVVWKAPVPGRGSSTPIVWGDQVFLLTAIDTGKKAEPKDRPKADPKFEKKTTPPDTYHQFVVLAFDRKTGQELWRRTVAERVPHEGHHFSHSYAAGSPTTDGQRLYVSFGSFGVYALGLDGKLLWGRDLGRLETRLGWGEASTPVVHDGKLFLTWDHEGDSFLTALDAASGKTLWKVDRDEPSSWATPLVTRHNGRTQVVTPGTRRVRGYDAADGKELWSCEGLTINCIPSPLRYGDTAIVLAGYRGSKGAAVALDARGDVTGSDKVRWVLDKGTPYVPSPALVGDRLWFTQTNDGLVSSVDVKTGQVVIDRARLGMLNVLYASPLAAAGRVYLTSRDGVTAVLKQADKLEVLAVNRLGEAIDASPVAVGKRLFLRGDKHLWCFQER